MDISNINEQKELNELLKLSDKDIRFLKTYTHIKNNEALRTLSDKLESLEKITMNKALKQADRKSVV